MKQRTRKLIGTFGTVIYLAIYSLVMMAVGGWLVVGKGTAYELPFFIVAGVLWIPGAMLIIKWMARPDPET